MFNSVVGTLPLRRGRNPFWAKSDVSKVTAEWRQRRAMRHTHGDGCGPEGGGSGGGSGGVSSLSYGEAPYITGPRPKSAICMSLDIR